MQTVNATGEWGDASAPPESPPPNPGGARDFLKLPHWLACRKRDELSDCAKLVYAVLLYYADDRGVARVKVATIARDLGKRESVATGEGKDSRTVRRALHELRECGLIAVTLRREKRGASDYRLRQDHEWRAEYVAKAHAKRREPARGSRPGDWFSRLPRWLARRDDVSDSAKITYARLGNHAELGGWWVANVKVKTLADEVGKGSRAIRRALSDLEGFELLRAHADHGYGGAQRANLYAFPLSHSWQAEAANQAEGNGSANGFTSAEPPVETVRSPLSKLSGDNGQDCPLPPVETVRADKSLSPRTLKKEPFAGAAGAHADTSERTHASEAPKRGRPAGLVALRGAGEPDAAKRSAAELDAKRAEIERYARGHVELLREGNHRLATAAREALKARGYAFEDAVLRRSLELLAEPFGTIAPAIEFPREARGVSADELPKGELANAEQAEPVLETPEDGSA